MRKAKTKKRKCHCDLCHKDFYADNTQEEAFQEAAELYLLTPEQCRDKTETGVTCDDCFDAINAMIESDVDGFIRNNAADLKRQLLIAAMMGMPPPTEGHMARALELFRTHHL